MLEAGPWTWFGPAKDLGTRIQVGTSHAIAEVSLLPSGEWAGYIAAGPVRLTGSDVNDVTSRIDAILKMAGWTLAQPPSPAAEQPSPMSADRVVGALLRDPRLLFDVKKVLAAWWVVGPWECVGSQWVRREANGWLVAAVQKVERGYEWQALPRPNGHHLKSVHHTEDLAKAEADRILSACEDFILLP